MKLAEQSRRETESHLQKEKEKIPSFLEKAKQHVKSKIEASHPSCSFEALIDRDFGVAIKSFVVRAEVNRTMMQWLNDEGFDLSETNNIDKAFLINWSGRKDKQAE